MLLAILSGALVGASLGLTGGGGSIFAVPLLVYGLGLELRRAVALSLAVVGVASLYGAILQVRRGHVLWRAGAMLGAGGIVAAPAGAWLGGRLPDAAGLYLFAGLMVLVGVTMLRNPAAGTEIPLGSLACKTDEPAELRFSWRCAAKLIAAGGMTGMLSGMFGVGGGFLAVPALLVTLRVNMAVALATSLVAIAFVSASALAANASHIEVDDLQTGLLFLFGAGLGMTFGVGVKKRIPDAVLKRVFGWAIIAIAGLTVAKTYVG